MAKKKLKLRELKKQKYFPKNDSRMVQKYIFGITRTYLIKNELFDTSTVKPSNWRKMTKGEPKKISFKKF